MVPKASKTIMEAILVVLLMVYGAKVGGFDEGLGHGSYFKPAIKQHVLCTLCMSCYCLMLIAYAHCSIKSQEGNTITPVLNSLEHTYLSFIGVAKSTTRSK